jgi:hypothetical protein
VGKKQEMTQNQGLYRQLWQWVAELLSLANQEPIPCIAQRPVAE